MGAGSIALTVLRVVVIMAALAVVGLSIWAKIIIHDMEIRGTAILDTVTIREESKAEWRSLFDIVLGGQFRIWLSIAISLFTTLATTLIILSQHHARFHLSPFVAHPLEVVSMFAMTAAFGAILSLTLKLSNFDDLPTPVPDLTNFSHLIALSRFYAIAAGTGCFTLLMTSVFALVQTYHRSRDSKPCSFEPTASALGMGHGYQAVAPRTSRGPIPTLYDPLKPMPGLEKVAEDGDEEKGFAKAGADMGTRTSQDSREAEKEISGPLSLQKPETAVKKMRPAHRPWSEYRNGS